MRAGPHLLPQDGICTLSLLQHLAGVGLLPNKPLISTVGLGDGFQNQPETLASIPPQSSGPPDLTP